MKSISASKITGYAMALVFGVLSIAILTGMIKLQTQPSMRYLFGTVLLLMSVYRFVLARSSGSRENKGKHLLLLLMFLLGLNGCNRVEEETESPTSGKLIVCTADPYLSLIKKEADLFHSLYTSADVRVISATTREAVVALLNDSIPAIIIDRRLNDEEQKIANEAKVGFEELQIAEDGLAVLVHQKNSIENLTQKLLEDILRQKVTRWNQIPDSRLSGPIVLVITGRNSGTYELLKSTFFNLDQNIVPSIITNSQQEVLNFVANHPRAIGLVSVACYKDTSFQSPEARSQIHALAFVGVDSLGQQTLFKLHQANIYLGQYPLHYPVYAYYSKRSQLALGFYSFIASANGQKIILDWGLVPATMPVRLVQITSS